MDHPAPPPVPLPTLLDTPASLREGLGRYPLEARRQWMEGLGLWQLRALWRLAETDRIPLALEDLVPDEAVRICPGKNQLPLFAWFEKRFARIGDEVVGYNETGWQALAVGPGHFTVRADPEDRDTLLIDYGRVPTATHPDFPALRDNDAVGFPGPLSRWVYGGGMVDRLRRITPHVLVGRAETPRASLQRGAVFALFLPG